MEHEYSVLGGKSRTEVGRYLSILAAGVSAVLVFALLRTIDLAASLGLPASLPPSVLSLVGAGAVFTALYKLLDRYAWKWALIARFLKVPNLEGEWAVQGATLNSEGTVVTAWTGTLAIVQSWDRIRVRLTTDTSGSNSLSAALVWDTVDGYRLFYSYRNDPRIGQTELRSHRGFAEITFANDLKSAEGEYFNGYGRYTFGTLNLARRKPYGA